MIWVHKPLSFLKSLGTGSIHVVPGIAVNPRLIELIEEHPKGSIILFLSGKKLIVSESVHEIASQIEPN